MKSEKDAVGSNRLKFIIFSIIGFFLFLVPVPHDGSFTIPVGIIINYVDALIFDYTLLPVVLMVVVNAVMTIVAKAFKPDFIMNNKWFKGTFDVPMLYAVSRVIGMIITLLFYFKVGPEMLISELTAGVMFDLVRGLVPVLLVISFLMPLLTEFGIMEFLGILLTNIVRPLFLLPGRAAVDLITSWVGPPNAAVLLTEQQYDGGFYTGKEAAILMTNFSFVSIPFAYIVADFIDVSEYFAQFYLIATIAGFAMAIVMSRIYPLKGISEEYNPKTGKLADENVPEDMTRMEYALHSASERAAETTVEDVISQGLDMFSAVIFGLAPIIIAWGTLSLVLVEFTQIFNIIAYPMGLLLQVLGIPEAMAAAPATLTGFADMFIPPVMLASISSVKTRFIVGIATLLQLIYLTEVGAIILQSDVPLNFKDLLIIFLERTVLALIIVTGLSALIMSF